VKVAAGRYCWHAHASGGEPAGGPGGAPQPDRADLDRPQPGHHRWLRRRGNTAAAGADLAQQEWSAAIHSSIPIGAFVVGVCVGAVVKQEGIRRGLDSWFAISCVIECLLLGALVAFGRAWGQAELTQNSLAYVWLVALPCLAMGVQSASFQRVGSVGVRTTFVTGILTGFGEELVSSAYHRRRRGDGVAGADMSVSAPNRATLERAMLFGGLWLAYLVGGLLAGIGLLLWQLDALVVPALGLVVLAVLDVLRPTQPSLTRT